MSLKETLKVPSSAFEQELSLSGVLLFLAIDPKQPEAEVVKQAQAILDAEEGNDVEVLGYDVKTDTWTLEA